VVAAADVAAEQSVATWGRGSRAGGGDGAAGAARVDAAAVLQHAHPGNALLAAAAVVTVAAFGADASLAGRTTEETIAAIALRPRAVDHGARLV
jgi:hypothetical protein